MRRVMVAHLNEFVTVRLNVHGLKLYDEWRTGVEEWAKTRKVKQSIPKSIAMVRHPYEVGNTLRLQLWEVLMMFGGERQGMGSETPFVDAEIVFEESK